MPDRVQLYCALAASGAAATAYAVHRLFASLSRDRFVTDTPLVKIRSAAQGYARLEGHVPQSAPQLLAAPLSGRACVWWDFRIDIKETDSRGNSHWSELERATSVAPFALTDDLAGTCLVGPVGAEVTPTDKDTWYGDTPRPVAGPPQNRWLGAQDFPYRYTERLIGPGARLSVLGQLRSHAEDGEVDAGARELLTAWKDDQRQLLARFDTDHDGRIDAQEWDAARAAAHEQAQHAQADARIQRVSVVAQPTHGQPFLIAPMDGERLARRERFHAWLSLAAAIVFLTVTVWSLHRLQQPLTYTAAPLPTE
jgi:hypothetical protein